MTGDCHIIGVRVASGDPNPSLHIICGPLSTVLHCSFQNKDAMKRRDLLLLIIVGDHTISTTKPKLALLGPLLTLNE